MAKVINAKNWGEISDSRPSTPNAPTDTAVSRNGTTLTVTWRDPDDSFTLSEYRLYESINGGPFTVIRSVPPVPNLGTASHVKTGASWSTSYTYYATCVTDAGIESLPSPTASITLPAAPPPPPDTQDRLEFAHIPEIVFTLGFREREELGIYFIDPSNRIAPGDLWWQGPYGTRLQRNEDHGGGDYTVTKAITYTGSLPNGVTFNSSTGELTYSGNTSTPSSGTIVFEYNGVKSNPVVVRVVRPTYVWGENAATRQMPAGYDTVPRYDKSAWTFNAASLEFVDEAEVICLVLTGTYDIVDEGKNNWSMGLSTSAATTKINRKKYILGEPSDSAWPTFYKADLDISSHAELGFDWPPAFKTDPSNPIDVSVYQHLVEYMKRIRFTGRTNVYRKTTAFCGKTSTWTQLWAGPTIYAASEDGIGSDGADGFTAGVGPDEIEYDYNNPLAQKLPSAGDTPTTDEDATRESYKSCYDYTLRYHDIITNCHFHKWLGGGGTKHPIYVHGGPLGFLSSNNVFHQGGYASSAFKSTRPYNVHLNDKQWQFDVNTLPIPRKPTDPTKPDNSLQRNFDQAAASCTIIYNCEMENIDRAAQWIWFSNRQTHFGGNIWPPYPDITCQSGVASFTPIQLKINKTGVSNGTNPKAWIKGSFETTPRLAVNPPTFYSTTSQNTWLWVLDPADTPVSGEYKVTFSTDTDATGSMIPGEYGFGANTVPGIVSLIVEKRSDTWIVSSSYPRKAFIPLLQETGAYDLEKFDWGGKYFDRALGEANAKIDDPENPYAFNHYVAYCKFLCPEVDSTYVDWDGQTKSGYIGIKGETIDDQSTWPNAECGSLGPMVRGTVPPGFDPMSRTFMMHNVYRGWKVTDELINADTNQWLGTAPIFRWEYFMKNSTGSPAEPVEVPNGEPEIGYARIYGVDVDGVPQRTNIHVSNQTASSPDPKDINIPSWFGLSDQKIRDAYTLLGEFQRDAISGAWSGNLAVPSLNSGNPTVLESGPGSGVTMINWANKGCWDRVNREIVWIGAKHNSENEPYATQLVSYNDRSQVWSAVRQVLGTIKSGHTYDNNAIDVKRRRLYKVATSLGNPSDLVCEIDLDTKGLVRTFDPPAQNVAPGLEYFESRDELVYFQGGTTAKLWTAANGGTSWVQTGTVSGAGAYHTIAARNEMAACVIFGGGNGSSKLWKYDYLGNITPLADAPTFVGYSESANTPSYHGSLVEIPGTTKMLLMHGSGVYYTFDILTNTWSASSPMPAGLLQIDGGSTNYMTNVILIPINTYGIVLAVKWRPDGNSVAFAYKG